MPFHRKGETPELLSRSTIPVLGAVGPEDVGTTGLRARRVAHGCLGTGHANLLRLQALYLYGYGMTAGDGEKTNVK